MSSIFDKLRYNGLTKEEYEERQRRLAEKIEQERLEAHQKELQELGITEEQYQEEQRKKEIKERRKEIIGNILRGIGATIALILVIAFFCSDMGETVMMIIGGVMVLVFVVLAFALIYMLLSGLMEDWKMTKFWKTIITIILAIVVLALIIWAIGSSGIEITRPIHERF